MNPLRIVLIFGLILFGFSFSGCQVVRFFSSDENCLEKVKEAGTCGALVEENFSNCKNVADSVAASESTTDNLVTPDYGSCDNDRAALQTFCWSTVNARCL